jgi:uncharacterized protein (DUF2147 family)
MLMSARNSLLAATLAAGLTGLPVAGALAQVAAPGEIVGVWETENRQLKLEMFDAGGTYAARVIYGARLMEADGQTFKKDTQNPDPALRDRSLQGIVFLSSLKWNAAEGRWDDGAVYDAQSGRTLSAQVTLVGGKMELRGYMGTPLLGQTVVLQRTR